MVMMGDDQVGIPISIILTIFSMDATRNHIYLIPQEISRQVLVTTSDVTRRLPMQVPDE